MGKYRLVAFFRRPPEKRLKEGIPKTKFFQRLWTPLIALTCLSLLIFFWKIDHPALLIFKLFSLPLTVLSMGAFLIAVIPRGWLSHFQRRNHIFRSTSLNYLLPLILFFSALILFSFVRSSLISSNPDDIRLHYLLTGDEPSYLLITHSLVFDGDLDLSNNRQDYVYFNRHQLLGDQFGFNFYNRIAQGRLTGKERDWGDRQYFINRPGLPALIAPAYWIGFQTEKRIRFAVLVWINLMAAFLVVLLFYLARAHSGPIPAASVAIYFAMTSPMIYYSSQVYPDLPAAFFLAGALLGLIKAKKKWAILATGLLVAYLPWLHERFIGLFLVLIVAALFRPDFRRRWFLFLVLPLLSLIFQGIYYYSFYGLPFPLNSHKALSFFAIPRGLLALGTDRDKGLLFINPLIILSFFGLIPLWRQDRRLTITLIFLLLAFLVPVASFPDWHGGICPPLRYLVILVPLSIIPIGTLFKNDSWVFSRSEMFVLGAFGLWIGLTVAIQPKLWFWEYGPIFNPMIFRAAHAFSPGYFHPQTHSGLLSLYWIALIGLFPFLDLLLKIKQKKIISQPVFPWTVFFFTLGVLIISISSWLIKN
ncbi:MAG: hypothetical protein V2B13_20150 [Pseudomonadota bacterium]